jgi:uncharacterized membrane protein
MPRVARQEARPEDWAATTAQAIAWERGYIHAGQTLICRECGVTIPNSFSTSGTYGLAGPEERHDDWHERMDRGGPGAG